MHNKSRNTVVYEWLEDRYHTTNFNLTLPYSPYTCIVIKTLFWFANQLLLSGIVVPQKPNTKRS